MEIANPIYDAAFKYLMQDDRAAPAPGRNVMDATARTATRAGSVSLAALVIAVAVVLPGRSAAQAAQSMPDPLRWQRWPVWSTTGADAPLAAAESERRADLVRHIERTIAVEDGGVPLQGAPGGRGAPRVEEVFPLAGALLEGREFWAAPVVPPGWMDSATLYVHERAAAGARWPGKTCRTTA